MSHAKAVVRLMLLIAISVFFLLPRLLAWPIAAVSRKTDRLLRRVLLRCWACCFAWVAGVRVVNIGPAPKPPFFMVVNHLSYLDMLVLARQTGCIFVSRGDVEHWPVFGFIARSLYILFINRENKRDTARINQQIKQTLDEGDGIVVFPESRVSCGLDIEPFKSPLLQPAIDLDMPAHYATLYYRTFYGDPHEGALVSWWRPEPFYVHLYRFLRYKGAVATIHFGEQPVRAEDRKALASRLHAAARANFKPLRQALENYAEGLCPIEAPDNSAPSR